MAQTTTPEAPEAVTAESLGWQLRSALPPMRLHSVSICNHEADVLWLSEGALGPDEHGVVIEAIETLRQERTQLYHELGMEDGRMAIFLAIRAPRGDLVGTVMILADMKSVHDNTMERILTPQMKTLLQKVAVFMRKNYPQATDTSQMLAIPPAFAAQLAATAQGAQAAPVVLEPQQVDAILSLELVDPPAPARAAPTPAPAPKAPASQSPKAAAQVKTAPPPKPANTAPSNAQGASGKGAAVQPAPEPGPAPLPEIEVLDFDPRVPTAGPAPTAAASVPEADLLQFDAEIEIPAASAAPSTPPTPGAEAIAFELEAPVPDQPAAPAPAQAAKSAPAASVKSAPATASTKAPPKTQPTRDAHADTSSSAGAKRLDAARKPAEPAATAPAPSDTVILINDTGRLPQLESSDETTTVEPALALPDTPPPPPLSAEETAEDLTLYVQELIKLRSSGRTRRYEVLARSQRDAHRNEVPTAFIAETANGREGAALDALVVERLLKWLGQYGEAIWDSEPASFSVNLSIGALEDATFPGRIAQWLEAYNVPAEYVGFELSEFACIQCRPHAERFVQACERMGCFLVIDNFSFDSKVFEFLGSKALRHVKIDPRLTTSAMKDKLPQALVVAILQACKVLGVHCVAKKIESQSALQWLKAVGCDFAQSFALEKPAPLDSLARGAPVQALRE